MVIFFIPLVVLCILVKLTSKGPVIYWSKRIGINNDIFLMPKIRSMHIDTPQVATDLLNTAANKYLTPTGRLLRKTSFDELPQLWSVITGDMSLVGPRPALFNQYKLIDLRTKKNIHTLKPGITGWAQVNGRDIVSDQQKVELDEYYLKNKSILLDFKILFLTVVHVVRSTNVTH
jgi:O-antigen biosynthesis protein WbqP